MSVEMTPEVAATLRKPFDRDEIGKLPRVWCGKCREANKQRRPACEQHEKKKCRECGNNITDAHLHLDYVGHAEVTDRLLQADPYWNWEPFALSPTGLPLLDEHGGMWIRLTVAGVTRLGYGHADGKDGPDAVKEVIGDCLRNAAMRFGVAVDLWGAKWKAEQHGEVVATPSGQQRQQNGAQGQQQAVQQQPEEDPRREAYRAASVEARALEMSKEEFHTDFQNMIGVPMEKATASHLATYARQLADARQTKEPAGVGT